MTDTVATYSDSDGLEYLEAPSFAFDVGERFFEDRFMNLHIDGELCEKFVLFTEITGRERELVVSEREWYITYRLTHYGIDGEELTTIPLYERELIENAPEPTDRSVTEMVERAYPSV